MTLSVTHNDAALLMELPLFPLSTIVLPGGQLPLRLFEPRYIDMVKNCFKTDSGFGVCLIKDGREAGAPAQPYPQGTLVKIIDFDQGPDGLLHITAQGLREFNLLTYAANKDDLIIGEVELLDTSDPVAMNESYADLSRKLAIILQYIEPNVVYTQKQLDEPEWICHRLLELLPLSAASKFELLQLPGTRARLDALVGLQIEFSNESP